MQTIKLLYEKEFHINDDISVMIPTVGQVLKDEDVYYDAVSMLTAMPIDLMVQLDDIGIDFTTIDEYELFLNMTEALKKMDMKLVFGNLDFSKFNFAISERTGELVLFNDENNIIIDRIVHNKVAMILRKINNIERDDRRPGNDAAKEYMIERARKKQKRAKNRKTFSQLEQLIIAMVNTEQFKYDFESVMDLTIYQFNESVRQVIKKVDYDNVMHGVYAGTVNPKDLNQSELTWFLNEK